MDAEYTLWLLTKKQHATLSGTDLKHLVNFLRHGHARSQLVWRHENAVHFARIYFSQLQNYEWQDRTALSTLYNCAESRVIK